MVVSGFAFWGVGAGMGDDGIAHFGDEEDGVDLVVEDVGTDEKLYGAVEGGASVGDEYGDVL